MSQYYTSHVGVLRYLSREFRLAAAADSDGQRFDVYAQLLERMADDLRLAVGTAAHPGGSRLTKE